MTAPWCQSCQVDFEFLGQKRGWEGPEKTLLRAKGSRNPLQPAGVSVSSGSEQRKFLKRTAPGGSSFLGVYRQTLRTEVETSGFSGKSVTSNDVLLGHTC